MKLLKHVMTWMALFSVANCHPINMMCVSECNPNITVDVEFVNEWLNYSNAKGIHQLRNHIGTVVNVLLNNASTDIDDCEEAYNSLITIPESTNTSIDAIRDFYNAYLLHKYFVDYVVNLNISELVHKNWIHQTNSDNLYRKLLQLQDVLNYNIQKLDHLLVTTCGACISNCSQVTTLNGTLIAVMERCVSPIYNVVNTIASHSKRLFGVVKNLQSDSEEVDYTVPNATTYTMQDVENLCFCDVPVQSTI